jgi:uncharacterized protein YggU (UPF0235/DUF167 family)
VRRRRPGRGDDRRAPDLSAELPVRVQARAGLDEIVGERGGRLLVRIGAAPVGGAANQALRRLIAKRAGVAAGSVAIVRGERSRDKLVRVEGVSAAELRRSLAGG